MSARPERLPVREHLQPRKPKLDIPIALEWTRLPDGERDPHGWRWSPRDGWPADLVEAFDVAGEA